MSPPERYPDGSEKGESAPSSSGASGGYRFPKSNVSEIEARRTEQILAGTYRDPETGKTANEEAYDSMFMLSIALVGGGLFLALIIGILIWLL